MCEPRTPRPHHTAAKWAPDVHGARQQPSAHRELLPHTRCSPRPSRSPQQQPALLPSAVCALSLSLLSVCLSLYLPLLRALCPVACGWDRTATSASNTDLWHSGLKHGWVLVPALQVVAAKEGAQRRAELSAAELWPPPRRHLRHVLQLCSPVHVLIPGVDAPARAMSRRQKQEDRVTRWTRRFGGA